MASALALVLPLSLAREGVLPITIYPIPWLTNENDLYPDVRLSQVKKGHKLLDTCQGGWRSGGEGSCLACSWCWFNPYTTGPQHPWLWLQPSPFPKRNDFKSKTLDEPRKQHSCKVNKWVVPGHVGSCAFPVFLHGNFTYVSTDLTYCSSPHILPLSFS